MAQPPTQWSMFPGMTSMFGSGIDSLVPWFFLCCSWGCRLTRQTTKKQPLLWGNIGQWQPRFPVGIIPACAIPSLLGIGPQSVIIKSRKSCSQALNLGLSHFQTSQQENLRCHHNKPLLGIESIWRPSRQGARGLVQNAGIHSAGFLQSASSYLRVS